MKFRPLKYIVAGVVSILIPGMFILLTLKLEEKPKVEYIIDPEIKQEVTALKRTIEELRKELGKGEEERKRPDTKSSSLDINLKGLPEAIVTELTPPNSSPTIVIPPSGGTTAPYTTASVITSYNEQLKAFIDCPICQNLKDSIEGRRKIKNYCRNYNAAARKAVFLQSTIAKVGDSNDGSDYGDLKDEILTILNELKFYFELLVKEIGFKNISCPNLVEVLKRFDYKLDQSKPSKIFDSIELSNKIGGKNDLGGFSGLEIKNFDPETNEVTLLAVSDGSQKPPGLMTEFSIKLDSNMLLKDSFKIYNTHKLDSLSPESIRIKDNDKQFVYGTSEFGNDPRPDWKEIWVSTLEGALSQRIKLEFEFPFSYNAGLEGMELFDSKIVVALEKLNSSGQSKFYIFNAKSGELVIDPFSYTLSVPCANANYGISEILHYKDYKFLVLERGLCGKTSYSRIYLFDLLGNEGKKLVHEFGNSKNFEGMCWGPDISRYEKTLFVISDNNYKGVSELVMLGLNLNQL